MPVVHFPAMATSHAIGQQRATAMPASVKNEPRDAVLNASTAPSSGSMAGPPRGQLCVPPPLAPPAHCQKPQTSAQRGKNSVAQNQEVPEKDPVDISSIRGLFGWATIDGVSVPHLLREDQKYVAVRIVEQKLLARFPNTFPEELGEHEPLVSYYVTQNELRLLDEINSVHCNFDYGRHKFTNKDLIVKLSEFENFYNLVKRTFPQEVLEARRLGIPLLHPSELAKSKSGWIQINNTVTPYFRRNGAKYVVLQIIKHAAKLLQDVEIAKIFPDEEEYKLINDMCSTAGLKFQFAKNTRLVSLEDVKRHHKVTLVELPIEEPMKFAQYNVDSNKNEEEEHSSSQPTQMTTPKQQSPVPAPQTVQIRPPFPAQQNAQYVINHQAQLMPQNSGVQQRVGAVQMSRHPATRLPFINQYPVNSSPSAQYVVRNPVHPTAGQQFAPYPSQVRGESMMPRQAANMPLTRQPPPYPGMPVTHGGQQGSQQGNRPDYSISSSRIQLADYINKRATQAMQNRRKQLAPQQGQGQNVSLSTSQQNLVRASVPGMLPNVVNLNSAQHSIGSNKIQGYRQPVALSHNIHQGPVNPTQLTMMQALQTQMPPAQQQAQIPFALYNQPQVGVNQMPGMNNILQRPPFQTNLPNPILQVQANVSGGTSVAQNPSIRPNNSVTVQQTQQGVVPQHMSSYQPIQQRPVIPTASQAMPNVQSSSLAVLAPKPCNEDKESSAVSIANQQPAPVPGHQTVENKTSQASVPAKTDMCTVPNLVENASLDTASAPNSGKSETVDEKLKINIENKPVSLPITTEAAEVVKISQCVHGVKFEGKSISCLEYERLPGKYALIEAVSKLYFPQSNINEFLFVLEQVLGVPTTACQPNEEKAFIHYYCLPVPVLKCNKMVKLDDLSKYYPQLMYMFAKKNANGSASVAKGLKNQNAKAADVDEKDSSGVVCLEETPPTVDIKDTAGGTSSSTANPSSSSMRPSGAAKRKHYSGSGQPSKQPRRLEDMVERLKQKPETSTPGTAFDTADGNSTTMKTGSTSAEDGVIVIE